MEFDKDFVADEEEMETLKELAGAATAIAVFLNGLAELYQGFFDKEE